MFENYHKMGEDFQHWNTSNFADIAANLTESIEKMEGRHQGFSPEFNVALSSSLQELSLRITQLSGSKSVMPGVDLQERRHLTQKSRQCLQEAALKLKEDGQTEIALR